MLLKILGSGGSIPTPRIGSSSEISMLARKYGYPYKRNCSCLGIIDINTIIDCPEDINDSICHAGITDIDNIFITHWHPDHSFGLRLLLTSVFDPVLKKKLKMINLYMPRKVYQDLLIHYPALDFFINKEKYGKVNFLEHKESIYINDYKITTIGYEGKDSRVNGYLIEENKNKVLYTPCETILFDQFGIGEIDVLITECGIFSHGISKEEIGFPNMIENIKKLNPKKTYITHIEEVELSKRGTDYLDKLKKENNSINFEFATDGLEIRV